MSKVGAYSALTDDYKHNVCESLNVDDLTHFSNPRSAHLYAFTDETDETGSTEEYRHQLLIYPASLDSESDQTASPETVYFTQFENNSTSTRGDSVDAFNSSTSSDEHSASEVAIQRENCPCPFPSRGSPALRSCSLEHAPLLPPPCPQRQRTASSPT